MSDLEPVYRLMRDGWTIGLCVSDGRVVASATLGHGEFRGSAVRLLSHGISIEEALENLAIGTRTEVKGDKRL